MLTRVTDIDSPLYRAVETLFLSSFPEAERRPLASLHRLMRSEERFRLDAAVRGDTDVIGLMATWQLGAFRYVEYLAVRDNLRGQGVGSRLLQQWCSASSLPVVLEVEPPVDELTRRRVAFYERLGFKTLDVPYEQPSYGAVPGLPLRLMQYGTLPDITTVIKTLRRDVYGCCEDDRPE